MSSLLFPSMLPGFAVKVTRESYRDVQIEESVSGKETRSSWWFSPRVKYGVEFTCLRANGLQEFQTLGSFLSRHFGQQDSFLFTDPGDNAVTDQGFAVGDGTTTAFQLQRTLGGNIIDESGISYVAQTKPVKNLAANGSFEYSSGGVATSWVVYNNSSATEPSVGFIVPGLNGGSAQRVSWGTPNTTSKGMSLTTPPPAWLAGQWYTVSFSARASGTNIGQVMGLAWNNAPTVVATSNPVLSASWQKYLFQIFWPLGATVETGGLYLTVLYNSGTFGDLDLDLVQVEAGQLTAPTQPVPDSLTSATLPATRTPAYWPSFADGYEPVYDLAAPPTIYQDGDWMGRRQLYPFTRKNMITFSSAFDNAAWSKTNATITAAATTAPDGTTTGELFNEGTAVGAHFIGSTAAGATAGELRCYSVFVKGNTLPNIVFGRDLGSAIKFNLGTSAVDGIFAGSPITYGVQTSPLWPGWQRIWFTVRETSGNSSGNAYLFGTGDSAYTESYTGTSRSFYLWGLQVERVSVTSGPTPYIPTTTTAVSVTDYSASSAGVVTLAAALPAGAYLSWDGTYYRRVRLDTPGVQMDRIVNGMWSARVTLRSVKP